MKIHFITHGCKANQYDTEAFRQELQARGATLATSIEDAQACIINTCTVTNAADADARKAIRRAKRENPNVNIFVAGCSAALKQQAYLEMPEVTDVVKGHDALELALSVAHALPSLEQHEEAIGGALLKKNIRGIRAWLKIQDGCDRKCAFCATKLARGNSRSRSMAMIIEEAIVLSKAHKEIVLTGVHIGHYGMDLAERGNKKFTLGKLLQALVDKVTDTRFRLGSIEATEIDDQLVDLVTGHPRVATHLHIPMQAGSDVILKSMKRWHTREQYRNRVYNISERTEFLGLGADIIVGFPGESDENFQDTFDLVNSLPFNYAHVFPYSVRDNTPAALMLNQIPGNIAAERSRVLRELVRKKRESYIQSRLGTQVEIIVEEKEQGLSDDYLRLQLTNSKDKVGELVSVTISGNADRPAAQL